MSTQSPTQPRRAALARLAPIAVGTPMVESAESYVGRLAEAHGIERSTLHRFINSRGPAIYKELRGQLARLDAPTAQAAAYMERVAGLTAQPDVRRLGLSWLSGRVRAQHVLRTHRAWCPDCMAEMKTERTGYAPMLWSLASVRCCARHGRRLQESCATCGAQLSIRRINGKVWDRCTSCGNGLVPRGAGSGDLPSALDIAVLEQMGLLVSAAPAPGEAPNAPRFVEIVAALHRCSHRVVPCEMARRLGVSKGTISSLMSEQAQPGIDLCLRLSTAYSVQLPDLLLKRERNQAWLQGPVRHAPVVWAARAKPRVDWASVQRALDLEIGSEAALPVSRIAQQVRVDARHLAMRWPECTTALTERYRASVESDRGRERERIQGLIRSVDEVVSQRAVARMVGISRSARRFREAWQ